ncbi:XisH family protein [Spirulina major]|uniref:XisH family protein n=1 Tax=Spirulina major TaxID=270636 RepID=UPI000933510D|nr:XisH family protein [Spirulina major]
MARDIFHDLVKSALEQEGWTITADPYRLKWERVKFEIDLAAERILAAERGHEQIAVEIKSFVNPSVVTDFYGALGQFLSYRLVLQEVDPQRILYLAIPLETYQRFFQTSFANLAIQEYQLKLIVYDSNVGGLVKWIS